MNVFIEIFYHIIDVVIIGNIVSPFKQVTLGLALLIFLSQSANQIHQALTLESSILNLLLRFNLHIKTIKLQDLSRDNISRPKEVTRLGAKFIALIGNEFPEALIADTLCGGVLEFLEVILLLGESGGNESLVAGVLEVDDIVRFYLILLLGVLEPAVQDKFPQTFTLVLVYYVDSTVDRLLD